MIRPLFLSLLCVYTVGLWSAESPRVVDAWARTSAPSAEIGGAFAALINDGDQDDALVSASSPICDTVELHTHTRDAQGLLHMEEVARIPVPAHGRTIMKPGGFHFMLMDLKQALKTGEQFTLVCRFAQGAERSVTVTILAAGSMGPETNK